jgi:hypothetical protein
MIQSALVRKTAPFSGCLGLILMVALAVRTYHLAEPPWDYLNWRQSITLMVARDFARRGFDLLHPQVLWVGRNGPSNPSYFSAEFSIQSAIAAILYRFFGESDTIARMVTIAFSLLSVYFLYDLFKRRAGAVAACLAAYVYSLLPYHVFFGRVFMPDVPSIALALGGLNFLDRWTDDQKLASLLTAAVLTTLAVLQKLTVILVGVPMLYLFVMASGWRLWARRELYIFGAIVGIPAATWYAHASSMGRQSGFFIMQPFLFARHLELWLQPSFIRQVFGALAQEAFSPLGFGLGIVSLLWPGRGRAASLCRLWIGGAALLLFLIPEVLPENHYYLCLLMPGWAGLIGLTLTQRLLLCRFGPGVLIVTLLLFVGDAIHSVLPLFNADRSPRDLGILLNRLTAPQDLVVTESGGSPNVLYFADRRGWMLYRDYNPALVNSLAHQGARYYADAFVTDSAEHQEYFRALDSRFERLTAEEMPWAWPLYDLAPRPGLLHEVPTGEVQHLYWANFGDQIELSGISLRELLDRPTSVEVTYYWRCIKPIATDLRVFVHITNPAGKIVAQQDHWPLRGNLPTTAWREGDVIRERYVVVLPGSLPSGKYQIRIGWFDPPRGHRLPVLSALVSDGEDRAKVGEIEVRRPTRHAWFGSD